MKSKHYLYAILLIFCLSNCAIFAQTSDMLLKENTEALNANTAAVRKLTEILEKGGLRPVTGVETSSVEISDQEISGNVDASIKQMLKTLKWETNTEYKGMGSKDAKKGGTLKYVETSFPPTLRTCGKNANSTFLSMLVGLCYEAMLDLDPVTLRYVPNLAKRWGVADDKVTFFFEIDERARWSDGKPVVANDVVATWELYTDPGIEDPFSNDYYSKYEKPVAVTDRIVMIRSKLMNWRAFMSAGFMTILPGHIISKIDGKQYLEEYQFKLMPGSGPYTYDSSKVNEEINLSRRTDWWQADLERTQGYNNFDKLNFIFIQDENLVKEKFKKGELDWIYVNVAREWHQEFTPAMLPQIANGWIQKRKVFTHRPIGVSGIAFNMRKPPFNDIRVRKAIAHLYNREKMMDKLFFNEYNYLDSFYPNSLYENPNNPKIRYNPDEAVKLLEEAGWLQRNRDAEGWLTKDGKRFELSLNYVQKSSERILTIFQEDLKDVGIKLNLKQVTWATDIKEVGERNFEMSSRAYSGLLFPNPESSMHSKFADLNNNNNIWGLKNKRIDEICEKYPLMFDPDERIAAIREIDGIVCSLHLYALGWYAAHTRLLFWNKFGMPEYILSKTGDHRTLVNLWWFDEEKAKKLADARANNKELPIGPEEVRWWDEHYPPSKTKAEEVK
ncbi:MAG: microcin transport system substrate-binding protein [Clostridiales bacterium]|nr:microcin transport system substrate-binding protein [Clostridiales bacterium]MDN5282205.1 microcin transport system substrate-binding protein [Candidatus Ozemobacter sp.]